MHCIEKGRELPLRALGRCPQITDHNKQNKCKNIPEGSYDPGTLPPLAKGVCCFEIYLENEVMVTKQVIQVKISEKFRMNKAAINVIDQRGNYVIFTHKICRALYICRKIF
jgi:hypothetical protein